MRAVFYSFDTDKLSDQRQASYPFVQVTFNAKLKILKLPSFYSKKCCTKEERCYLRE